METIRIIECRTAGIPVTHIFQDRNIPIISKTMLDRPDQSSRILYQSHAIQAMQVYHQCFRLFLQRPCYIRSSQEKRAVSTIRSPVGKAVFSFTAVQ